MVLRTGYDAETVDTENAADLARATSLGLNYNTLEAIEQFDDKEQPRAKKRYRASTTRLASR